MPIKIRVPTPLQKLTANQSEVTTEVAAEGTTIKIVLENMNKQYPGLKERFYDEKGGLRRFINFYVNNEDIRFLKGEETALKDGDEISIVPAIAGGI